MTNFLLFHYSFLLIVFFAQYIFWLIGLHGTTLQLQHFQDAQKCVILNYFSLCTMIFNFSRRWFDKCIIFHRCLALFVHDEFFFISNHIGAYTVNINVTKIKIFNWRDGLFIPTDGTYTLKTRHAVVSHFKCTTGSDFKLASSADTPLISIAKHISHKYF
jgi:hypothetical protein